MPFWCTDWGEGHVKNQARDLHSLARAGYEPASPRRHRRHHGRCAPCPQRARHPGADASKDIDIELRNPGLYHLTVTPTDMYKPQSRTIAVCERGSLAIALIIDKGDGTTTAPP